MKRSHKERLQQSLANLNQLWDELEDYEDQRKLDDVLEPLYSYARANGIPNPENF